MLHAHPACAQYSTDIGAVPYMLLVAAAISNSALGCALGEFGPRISGDPSTVRRPGAACHLAAATRAQARRLPHGVQADQLVITKVFGPPTSPAVRQDATKVVSTPTTRTPRSWRPIATGDTHICYTSPVMY